MQAQESFRLLRWDDSLAQAKVLAADGRVMPLAGAGERWHYHREVEITLIESGSGRRIVGDHMARFTPPDLSVIGAFLPHYWNGLVHSSGLALQFDPLAPVFAAVPEMQTLRALWPLVQRGLRVTGSTRRDIICRLHAMPAATAPMRFSLLWHILSDLQRAPACDLHPLSQREFSHVESSPYQRQMEMAVRRVFEQAHRGTILLAPLLREIGMSKATFSRQFPRHTGRSFIAFVNEVRLEHARHLLRSSDQSITTVAMNSGFQNLSHFNAMFRRLTGMTPREYRMAGN